MNQIRSILIVGGGTAGWMAAAVLAKAFGRHVKITLLESEEIGTVGVGEATIPQLHNINRFLGFDENEFVAATKASFKLGIQFNDWRGRGDSYIHAFGDIGMPLGFAPFHHYWLRARKAGGEASLWDFSINALAARANKFQRMDRVGSSKLTGIRHAFHFDAGLYAKFLRRSAEKNGAMRKEGKVVEVRLKSDSGYIDTIILHSGETVSADFYIDCTGFRGLLIEGALEAGYEDWTRFLPCDRAVVAPCEHGDAFRPYTQATAQKAGWQWRIPLQHRVGNGHVFCSRHLGDDEATSILVDNLEGRLLANPRVIRFTTGMRKQVWKKNCVALGLASGFMEPLESTSIHLIQSMVSRLISLFPDKRFDNALIEEYNRQTRFEFERIRDFLILHYFANDRDDSDFWCECREINIPDALSSKINLFRTSGRIYREHEELFTEVGWLQVLIGQGIIPEGYHPAADELAQNDVQEFFLNVRRLIGHAVDSMPSHEDFIAQNCPAN
ncbi:MAG: tryptophan halogenase family protein [Parvularculaceae bacterium]